MSIFEEGPSSVEADWDQIEAQLAYLAAVNDDDSIGASVQKSVGRDSAMHDEMVGKVGPKIGVWEPEKTNRLIQEF